MKITVRKRLGSWFVAIPGDVPDFSKHEHFTDALAKVFFEIRRLARDFDATESTE